MASSAIVAWSESLSALENTATLFIPISFRVLIILTAISPLLATKTFLIGLAPSLVAFKDLATSISFSLGLVI